MKILIILLFLTNSFILLKRKFFSNFNGVDDLLQWQDLSNDVNSKMEIHGTNDRCNNDYFQSTNNFAFDTVKNNNSKIKAKFELNSDCSCLIKFQYCGISKNQNQVKKSFKFSFFNENPLTEIYTEELKEVKNDDLITYSNFLIGAGKAGFNSIYFEGTNQYENSYYGAAITNVAVFCCNN